MLKLVLLLVIVGLASLPCLSQPVSPQETRNKERKADSLVRVAGDVSSWKEIDYPRIYSNLEQALSIYQQINNKEKEIAVLWPFSYLQVLSGKPDLGEKGYLRVLDIYHSTGFRNLHNTYLILSAINRYKGDFNRALSYAMKCVKTMEETGDTASAADCYGELALVYQELGQTDKSIGWYRKTLEKRERNKRSQIFIYRTAGLLVLELLKEKKDNEALTIISDIGKKHPPVGVLENASLAQSKGHCYEALKRYDLAEKYYQDMIRWYDHGVWNDEIVAIARFDMGKFYVERKQYQKGGYYLRKALNTPPGTNTLSRIKDIHLMLFEVDSAAGDYLSAIKHFRRHKALNDSIFNDTKSKQIEELQIQYETEKKDKDITLKQQSIQLLTKQSQLQNNELKQANFVRNITLGSIGLLLIIVSLLYNRYRLKQRSNKKLEAQQKEIEYKNLSLQHLVQEKEWLLKEVHHRVKNNLQIIMSLLNSQSVYLENDAALQAIRNSQQRVHAISLIHQKLYQSENMAAIEMPVYIRELVEYLRDSCTTGQLVRFELDVAPVELDVSQAVPLGLILNEAITNAIKYAFPGDRPGIIFISFQLDTSNHFLLTIADNGIGMPAGFASRWTGSLGMSLMKGLTEEIAGSFTIENNDGTLIKVVFPSDHPINQLIKGKIFFTTNETTSV